LSRGTVKKIENIFHRLDLFAGTAATCRGEADPHFAVPEPKNASKIPPLFVRVKNAQGPLWKNVRRTLVCTISIASAKNRDTTKRGHHTD
jgi:hypothetical protein